MGVLNVSPTKLSRPGKADIICRGDVHADVQMSSSTDGRHARLHMHIQEQN